MVTNTDIAIRKAITQESKRNGEIEYVLDTYEDMEDFEILMDGYEMTILKPVKIKETKRPTKGEILLAIDIVKQQYPLFANADNETIVSFIRDIFKLNVTKKDISRAIGSTIKKVVKVEEHDGLLYFKVKVL